MGVNLIKEEMQFITGVITEDLEYLLYLILKNKDNNHGSTEVKVLDSVGDNKPYFKEVSLEDWFDNIEED